MNDEDHITRDPQIAGGVPIIKGTRVPVSTIVASVEDGDTIEDILKDFPTLTEADVKAALRFAEKFARG